MLCSCAGIEPCFDRGLVPYRADAGSGDRRPCGAGGLRLAGRRWKVLPQQFGRSSGSRADGRRSCRRRSGHPRNGEDRLLHRYRGRAVRLVARMTTTFPLMPWPRREAGLRGRAGGQGRGIDIEQAPVQLFSVRVLCIAVIGVGIGGGAFGHRDIGIFCRWQRLGVRAHGIDAMLMPAASNSSTTPPIPSSGNHDPARMP